MLPGGTAGVVLVGGGEAGQPLLGWVQRLAGELLIWLLVAGCTGWPARPRTAADTPPAHADDQVT